MDEIKELTEKLRKMKEEYAKSKQKKTENMVEYKRQYYQDHKEKFNKSHKENVEYVTCKICGKTIQKVHLELHNQTKFHMKHMFQKVNCECGKVVSKKHLTSHRNTKYHKDNAPVKVELEEVKEEVLEEKTE